MIPDGVVMKHKVRMRVPSRVRGLGQTTAAQQAASDAITNAAMAYNAAQIADAQAGLTNASSATLAAQQNLQSVTTTQSAAAAAAAPATTSSTYYVIAGVLGVAVLGALVYFATE